MAKFSRENSFIDILPLIGLLLIGGGVPDVGAGGDAGLCRRALIVVALVVAAMPVGRAE